MRFLETIMGESRGRPGPILPDSPRFALPCTIPIEFLVDDRLILDPMRLPPRKGVARKWQMALPEALGITDASEN
jgi:hypothetical protein